VVAGNGARGRLREPETALITAPGGVHLEYLMTGAGDPVTVFAHGLGNGIAQTRPLGSAVAGRRVFFHFRGHGRSSAPAGAWTYQDLAGDLRAVADSTKATRALGVSLGAGALCRALADDPDRFEKVVLFLPAVLDVRRGAIARERLAETLGAIRSGDPAEVAHVVARDVPMSARDTASGRSFIRARTEQLLQEGLADSLASLPDQVAVEGRTALSQVAADVLVIASRGDDLHAVDVAEQVAAALPHAVLHVYDEPDALWTNRADLRERIAGFFNAPATNGHTNVPV
jgi:pimeloyl-ACP methyl ester carboxylesterase